MSSKVFVLLLVVIVAAGVIWYVWGRPGVVSPANTQQAALETPPPPPPLPPPAPAPQTNEVSGRDASNVSLDADLKAFDTGMQAAQSDSALVDQGMNDKPVPQAQ